MTDVSRPFFPGKKYLDYTLAKKRIYSISSSFANNLCLSTAKHFRNKTFIIIKYLADTFSLFFFGRIANPKQVFPEEKSSFPYFFLFPRSIGHSPPSPASKQGPIFASSSSSFPFSALQLLVCVTAAGELKRGAAQRERREG